jgi:hypothetical protein
MSIPMASALGAGGPNIDFTLPPEFQKYSRQVLSRNPSSQYVTGPASIVNPYTGALPASASQAPTQVAAQAPQIVRLPINMEIERNRAAAGAWWVRHSSKTMADSASTNCAQTTIEILSVQSELSLLKHKNGRWSRNS